MTRLFRLWKLFFGIVFRKYEEIRISPSLAYDICKGIHGKGEK